MDWAHYREHLENLRDTNLQDLRQFLRKPPNILPFHSLHDELGEQFRVHIILNMEPNTPLTPNSFPTFRPVIDSFQAIVESVYQEFYEGRLKPETGPLAKRDRPKARQLLYHGHEAAWRLFECIVLDWGHVLDETHSNIDWIDVATEMGRPFPVDPDFAIHLHIHYYTHIAPIVKLWLFEIKREIARRNVAVESEQESASISTNHDAPPSIAEMAFLNKCILRLGMTLPKPLTFSRNDVQHLSTIKLDSPTDFVSYVCMLAGKDAESTRTSVFGRVARLLPSYLSQHLMNVLQWALDGHITAYDERSRTQRLLVIKFFQDLANESDEYPSYMFRTGYTQTRPRVPAVEGYRDPNRPIAGSEATVQFGVFESDAVALRVPIDSPSDTTHQQLWQAKQRYKRAIIHESQLRHENLVKILGLFRDEADKVCILMPRLKTQLREYALNVVRDPKPYKHMMLEIVYGLQYLHSQSVVHGDLHWKNILVDYEGSPKIADFGISRVYHVGGNSRTTDPFKSEYEIFMPPEILDSTILRPVPSTDIYSCGVVFACVALSTGSKAPYWQTANLTAMSQYFRNPTKVPEWEPESLAELDDDSADILWSLIRDMCKVGGIDNNAYRPSVQTVVQRLEALPV